MQLGVGRSVKTKENRPKPTKTDHLTGGNHGVVGCSSKETVAARTKKKLAAGLPAALMACALMACAPQRFWFFTAVSGEDSCEALLEALGFGSLEAVSVRVA